MNATARIRAGVLVCGSAVVLTALSLAGFLFATGGLSEERPPSYWFETVVVCLVLSAPWMVTVWLLRWAWRVEPTTSCAAIDPPARLLAVAAGTLPEGRRDWGAAMTAELAQVRAHSERWRFAMGCARAAIFPPRSTSPVVGAAALGAVVVGLTGLTVGEGFPPMRVFAMTFVGLIGAAFAVTVARSRPLPRPTSDPVVVTGGITGVAACIAATWYIVDQYPTAALHLHPGGAILLATLLAGALWLVVAPPRALTGDRLARPIALGLALLLGVGLVQSSRADLRGSAEGIFGYVFLMPIAPIFVSAVVVAAGRRSLWAGVQATVWTTLLTSLAFFAIAVAEAVSWYRAGSSLILAGDAIPLDAVGESIRNFTFFLVLLPVFWMPFGVIGAAIGRAGRARLSRAG